VTIRTMRFVPPGRLEGKHLVKLDGLGSGSGPVTYECGVCRKPVLAKYPSQLPNILLQCPHCGAYNATETEAEVPSRRPRF